MTIHICRNIISLHFKKSHLHIHKPHFSVLFFSSPRRKQPKISTAVFNYLLSKHKFSHETASKAASALAHLKNPEKCDAVLSFFKENGFSHSHLEKVVKKGPRMLSANLENTIMPKFKIFHDLGFTCTDIADIISGYPAILHRSVNDAIAPSILILRNLFGSIGQVSKLLKRYPYFLRLDFEKTLLPNVEFLESIGISRSQMIRYIFMYPRTFSIRLETMKHVVRRIDEMGLDRDSKMFIQAIRALTKMSHKTWELKLEFFRSIGLSDADVLFMFRRMPPAIAVSEKKIRQVLQLLLDTGKYDVSYVVNHPEFLLYSVERRLKPRLQVFGILESKNLLKKFPSMVTVYAISNEKFYKEFVSPYLSEVGHVYTAQRANTEKADSNFDAGFLKSG